MGVLGGGIVFAVCMLFFSVLGWIDYLDPLAEGASIWMTILSFVLAIVLGALVGYFLYKNG
jgi:hypothetical protein